VSDQFVAEIRIFPFNFPPTGWAFCQGQLMPISQNTALFSLLGTTYGGDGKSTFALPNMTDDAPIQSGQGKGLSEYFLGQQSGTEAVTLLQTELPIHTHTLMATSDPGNLQIPTPTRSLARSQNANAYKAPAGQPLVNMNVQALSIAGSDFPHNNMMPYLTLNYCIALQGIFPQRP
jgi:microcystin-dependent protein